MGNKPINMQKFRQVLTLLNQRYSKRETASITGVHRSIIDKYILRLQFSGLELELNILTNKNLKILCELFLSHRTL